MKIFPDNLVTNLLSLMRSLVSKNKKPPIRKSKKRTKGFTYTIQWAKDKLLVK